MVDAQPALGYTFERISAETAPEIRQSRGVHYEENLEANVVWSCQRCDVGAVRGFGAGRMDASGGGQALPVEVGRER